MGLKLWRGKSTGYCHINQYMLFFNKLSPSMLIGVIFNYQVVVVITKSSTKLTQFCIKLEIVTTTFHLSEAVAIKLQSLSITYGAWLWPLHTDSKPLLKVCWGWPITLYFKMMSADMNLL